MIDIHELLECSDVELLDREMRERYFLAAKAISWPYSRELLYHCLKIIDRIEQVKKTKVF